jgi:Tfp pilus assembly protein PilF
MPRHGGARAGKHNPQQVPSSASYYRIVLVVVAAVGVALQAAALGPLRGTFWGFHLFAFLPRWSAYIGWIGLAVAAAVLLFSPGWKRPDTPRSGRLDRLPSWAPVAAAVLCAVLFWLFRSNQTILGDGLPLTIDLPRGQSFHPRQPLSMWFQSVVFDVLAGVFAREDLVPPEVAHRTVAVGSVLAGFGFVLVAFGLGRAIVARTGEPTRGGGAKNDLRHSTALLVTLVLLCQGYAVLFFGYVENYTYYILTIALYLLASALYLKRRLPLAAAAGALVLGVGVHLSTVMLVPSFLFLAAWGLSRRDRRADAAAGVAAVVVGALLLNWVLGRLSPGYTLWGGLAAIAQVASKSQGGGAGLPYIFGWTHVRDFFNEHYLIGPLAAFLFLPGFVYGIGRRQYRDPVAVFLSLAAGFYLAGSWAMSDPLLGYARDWDLFAPAAVCYTAAGLYFLVSHVSAAGPRRRLLAFSVVLSLVHLAPWVWINHSQARSLERFKTLPLGYGRTEVAVGNWYLRHEQPADAKEWFKRAIEVNRYNVNAYFLLGVLYDNNGFIDPACKMFDTAIKLRPDKPDYRERYVRALLDAHRCQDAVPHLTWLARHKPADFVYWQDIGGEMFELGCRDSLAVIYEPVLAEIERRLKARPDDLDACVFGGIFLGNLMRMDEALEMFRRALEIDPNSPAGLFNTGMLLLRTGRRAEGRPYLEKFIALYPDHPMNEFAKQQLAPQSQKEKE